MDYLSRHAVGLQDPADEYTERKASYYARSRGDRATASGTHGKGGGEGQEEVWF